MSLPTPHIQVLSTYNQQRRTSTPLRNVSSPYSLAIPLRNKRLSTIASVDGDSPTGPKSTSIKSSDTLQVPTFPKKALILSEKPVRPYTCSGDSSSTGSPGYQHASPYTGNKKERFRQWLLNDHVLALSVTLTLALLLAIGIPLGVVLPQKLIKPLPINILVPFYVYPEPGVWERLYDA